MATAITDGDDSGNRDERGSQGMNGNGFKKIYDVDKIDGDYSEDSDDEDADVKKCFST